MNRCRQIDLENWPRRNLFEFYRKFDAPCFNVTVKVKADPLRAYAKAKGESFFLLCLYAILRAANEVPQIRQRAVDGRPVEFEKIAAMTPVMTPSEMFHQVWCEYEPDFGTFKERVRPDIERAKKSLPAPMEDHGEDMICASCSPWIHFESLTQAEYGFQQTIPVLAWGKLQDGTIPVAVKFSHCFVDGLHCSRFFEQIEHGFTEPETLLTVR